MGEMKASSCALCGRIRECLAREIDGTEYDICAECWNELAEKLKGKGRATKRDVVIPSPHHVRPEQEEKPFPGTPPEVWLFGRATKAN